MIAEDTVTIMEKAPKTTKTVTTLGNLSLFPREIRDEIYRHSLPKKMYCSLSTPNCASLYDYGLMRCHLRLHSKCREWTETNLSILCLSKVIKEEAMASLYLNGTFVVRNDGEIKHSQHPCTDRMTKIEVICSPFFDPDMDEASDPEYDTSMGYYRMLAGPLIFFQGDTITRKSILVILELGKFWRLANSMTTAPLFKALERLTGFETVTLRFAAWDYEWERAPDDKERERRYIGIGLILEDMSMSLEPTLGKSSAKSELLPEEIASSLRDIRIRDVVFHPRNHQAAISKAKKDE